jgi:2-succinyl-5-enolpyruvyl-6-hydroxy-3-cyclohexene-1-carboxylate synthase
VISDKQGIQELVEVLAQKGLRYVVICPGSRNAPLTISFGSDKRFECISIADERSAAFFALGIAMQTGVPAAVCCSSGSAVLNFAPAIAEAYYQQIPLLVLTADRPTEWIDQGDGQTMRQQNVYANYIKASFQLEAEKQDVWQTNRITNQAYNIANALPKGPVHLNIPLSEPLYGKVERKDFSPRIIEHNEPIRQISESQWQNLRTIWNAVNAKLVLCGQMQGNKSLKAALEALADLHSVAVLTENTSNLPSAKFNPCIDRLISGFTDADHETFRPQLLITVGNAVVSKKIKAWLRKHKAAHHWHIGFDPFESDTYCQLTQRIEVQPDYFFREINKLSENLPAEYGSRWKNRDLKTQMSHDDYLQSCNWSDLKAFQLINEYLPEHSHLHMGNSTPIRYFQLFNPIASVNYLCNRGVSGIDGCTSTAAGDAFVNGKPTTLVTGDVSFLYDSNGLWNNRLTENLRIVVINNGGGGIFRIIPGPDSTEQLEEFFESHHNYSAEHIAKAFQLPYYKADGAQNLEEVLPAFYGTQPNNRPALLEVFTPRTENSCELMNYFEYLKTN